MKYFIYYSNSGNGDLIASKAKEKGFEIIKIEPLKKIGKMNFFKILKYGGQAMFNKKMKIKDLNLSLKDDDEVIIGSPIWNDCLSTPINTLLSEYSFDKDTTKFILYPAGKTTNKSKEQIAKRGFKKEAIVISYPKKNEQSVIEALSNI